MGHEQHFWRNKMKTNISRMIATLTLTAAMSTSAFASQSLSEIMANHKEQMVSLGVEKASSNVSKALIENKITETEMRNYLASELSPKDFKKVEASLNAGIDATEAKDLVLNISNGANFKSSLCNNHFSQDIIFGGAILTAVTGIAAFSYLGEATAAREDARNLRVPQVFNADRLQSQILENQIEITFYKNQGVSATSYIVTDLEADIARLQLQITQGIANTALRNDATLRDALGKDSEAEKDQKLAATAGIIAGISGTVVLGTMLACE